MLLISRVRWSFGEPQGILASLGMPMVSRSLPRGEDIGILRALRKDIRIIRKPSILDALFPHVSSSRVVVLSSVNL
jgi:hypothetical protein